jgi:hypothetical protein
MVKIHLSHVNFKMTANITIVFARLSVSKRRTKTNITAPYGITAQVSTPTAKMTPLPSFLGDFYESTFFFQFAACPEYAGEPYPAWLR